MTNNNHQQANKNRKKRSYYFGIIAEKIVALWLICCGWKIAAQRYKTPAGEVDLIAIKKRQIVFIEIKARKKPSDDGTLPLTTYQQQRICRAASIFIAKHQQLRDYDMRFDLILVYTTRIPKRIRNAWNINERI